jgi:Bacteriophage translational regulator
MTIVDNLIEIKIAQEEDFLKIKETLTRIGIASRKEKKLYQSCHILHKQGKYYIVHFKELFQLDGKTSDFSDEDRGRRNVVCSLLEQWGLIKVVEPERIKAPVIPMSHVKVIQHKDKKDWILEAKYNIGKKRK